MMKENLSTKFILPMLGARWRDFEGLENCFIGDDLKGKEYNNHIFLLYSKELPRYEILHNDFINSNLYIANYSYDNYEMYVFRIPDLDYLKRDYELFKRGKYSEFSSNYKHHIIKFYNGKIQNYNILKSLEYQNIPDNNVYYNKYIKDVLQKNDYLRTRINNLLEIDLNEEYELCSPPEDINEVFNDAHLKELFNINRIDEWI